MGHLDTSSTMNAVCCSMLQLRECISLQTVCTTERLYQSVGEKYKGWTAFNDCDDTATHCYTLLHTATHILTALRTLFVNHTIDKEARYSNVPPGNLMCVAVCCSVLQCVQEARYIYVPPGVLLCVAVRCSVLTESALQCGAVCCSMLQCVAVFEVLFLGPLTYDIRNTLQHTATHCNTLQHTATHCNTLQHTATHCNTLHHTTSHYIVRNACVCLYACVPVNGRAFVHVCGEGGGRLVRFQWFCPSFF